MYMILIYFLCAFKSCFWTEEFTTTRIADKIKMDLPWLSVIRLRRNKRFCRDLREPYVL